MAVLFEGARLLPCLILVTVATKDILQRLRYRWTHWLGAGLALWNGMILIVWLVRWILFPPEPF